jgi:hypothetical protein
VLQWARREEQNTNLIQTSLMRPSIPAADGASCGKPVFGKSTVCQKKASL